MSVAEDAGRSIHPRVVGGRTVFEKANTAKPHKGGGKLGKRLEARSRRRSAHTTTINSQRNPEGYKAPGSMNEHKSSPRGRRL